MTTSPHRFRGKKWIPMLVAGQVLWTTGAFAGYTYECASDRGDAVYRLGETATITVRVLTVEGTVPTGGVVSAALDDFGDHTVLPYQTHDLSETNSFVIRGTLDRPGFLRLKLHSGNEWKFWSVGYEPEKIRPVVGRPADFETYWRSEIARLAREVPLDARRTVVRGKSDGAWNYYRVSFATFNGKRVYGFLTVPKAAGPHPLRVQVPGAGPSVWEEDGSPDEVRLTMNVFPFDPPETEQEMKRAYAAMHEEMARSYPKPHGGSYATDGLANGREAYFYHDIILGINRAVDWAVSLPEVDRARVRYVGQSQGGAFGHFLCALNGNFTRAVFHVPAMTDMLAGLGGRSSGWPQPLENEGPDKTRRPGIQEAAPYFDAVNFAPLIRIPVLYSVGFSDTICPPHCVYAAFNACGSSDKAILHGIGMPHSGNGKIWSRARRWLRTGILPPPVEYGETLRDRSWMWGHESWQVDGKHAKLFGLDVASNYYHMVEGAKSYGLENLNVIRWDKPDKVFRDSLKGMRRLTWPLSGNAGEDHTTYAELGDWTFAVADEMDNVTGFELDDYFVSTNETPTFACTPSGRKAVCPTRFPYDDLVALKRRMGAFKRPLELRLVVYDDLFKERKDPRDLKPVVDVVDSVTYWVWMADNIVHLERNFAAYRLLAPKKPTYLGVYLWDFGGAKPMPVDLLERQLELGLKWFREGEIVGLVFLCSSICNRSYPAVTFCREWISKHGDERWGSACP